MKKVFGSIRSVDNVMVKLLKYATFFYCISNGVKYNAKYNFSHFLLFFSKVLKLSFGVASRYLNSVMENRYFMADLNV